MAAGGRNEADSVEAGRFLVVGEALVDIVVPTEGQPTRAPGGSPLNVAVGLARLGHATTLLTRLGDDEDGALVRAHLERSGVRLDPGSAHAGPTSTATARLDASGAASYDFEIDWDLPPTPLPQGATGLHTGSLATVLDPGRAAVLDLVGAARERDLLVTFDPNARPALTPDADAAWDAVRAVAEQADLVKLSDEDLAFLRPHVAPSQLAVALLGEVTRLVVVTLGGHGALAFSSHGSVEVPTGPATVVDTVGAGDSLMGALVALALEHGLHDLTEDRLRVLLTAAQQVSAITVSRRGADPPRRDELAAGWPGL